MSRRALFGGLLAGLLAANAGAAPRPVVTAPTPAVAMPAETEPCPAAAANLFSARAWLPPPPPPRKPEPPRAPPLPFTYMGQLEEEGGIALFLGRDKRTLVVRRGDLIESSYRVEEVTPRRATFVFLPLDERQHLTLRTRP